MPPEFERYLRKFVLWHQIALCAALVVGGIHRQFTQPFSWEGLAMGVLFIPAAMAGAWVCLRGIRHHQRVAGAIESAHRKGGGPLRLAVLCIIIDGYLLFHWVPIVWAWMCAPIPTDLPLPI